MAVNVAGITPTAVATKSAPLPAHQQPAPAHQKVQYITSTNPSGVINLPQPILIPASQLSSTAVTQGRQSYVVTGNQMIGQPIVASSGPVYVAVPTTTLAAHHPGSSTTMAGTTVTSTGQQQRPLMIRAQIPQQMVRLARAQSPTVAARPQQFAFIHRGQPTAIRQGQPQQRLVAPGAMLRAQIVPTPQPPPAHSNNQQQLSASLRSVQGFTMIQVASATNPNTTVPARFAVPLKIVPSNSVQQLPAGNVVSLHTKSVATPSEAVRSSSAIHGQFTNLSSNIVCTSQLTSYDLSLKSNAPQNTNSEAPKPPITCSIVDGKIVSPNGNENVAANQHPAAMANVADVAMDASRSCEETMDVDAPQVSLGAPQTTLSPPQAPQVSLDAPQVTPGAPQVSLDAPQVSIDAPQASLGAKNETSAMEDVKSDEAAKPKTEPTPAPEPAEAEEHVFVWDEYLEETGAQAVPPTLFKHVETSLRNGFTKGMKLEVPNRCVPDTYWITTILMSCGPLLRLRYDGYDEDSSSDFWCDAQTSDIHEIGWCGKNGKTLQPPEAIRTKHESWHDFLIMTLEGAATAPVYLLEKNSGIAPIDHIKPGMRVIVQHETQPLSLWIASIVKNVGGRLLLRWEGTESTEHDFWLFYLDFRVHPMCWDVKGSGYLYRPPKEIKTEHDNYSKWSEILQKAQKEAESSPHVAEIFQDQITVPEHTFEVGMKLEIIHPKVRTHLSPATVIQVVSKKFFIVEIDDLQADEHHASIVRVCRHAASSDIFPVEWSLHNGVRLATPKGWYQDDFSWHAYLSESGAEAAPESCFVETHDDEHEFKRGMKLEAVNPHHLDQICAATITKIVDRIMWVHLDSAPKLGASFMVPAGSYDIFPVGWCESNEYPLKPPKQMFSKRVAVVKPESHSSHFVAGMDGSNTRCPKIFFNHRCFSGPFLSKGRIAELPKSVGPGPVHLVLKEVLSMLINVAYKSSRVLRELQLEGTPNANMHQQSLKAKYKGKSYRATVEICRSTDQLEEFCRQTCIKLECCPYLVSPLLVNGNCPENCQQLTKTKYTHYYGKKKKNKKIGRPPGGHTNLEDGQKNKVRGRRKKRRHPHPSWLHGPKKTPEEKEREALEKLAREADKVPDDAQSLQSSNASNEFNGDEKLGLDGDTTPDRKRRKYIHHLPPPSDIRTRGAKLPRYSFERRTHKKVLIEHRGGRDEMQRKRMHKNKYEDDGEEHVAQPEVPLLQLDSNPLTWSVSKVVRFVKNTDCANLARLLKEQEIDGQAFLMLNLPSLQEHLELKLGPAIKLCHQIERVKVAFYHQFAL